MPKEIPGRDPDIPNSWNLRQHLAAKHDWAVGEEDTLNGTLRALGRPDLAEDPVLFHGTSHSTEYINLFGPNVPHEHPSTSPSREPLNNPSEGHLRAYHMWGSEVLKLGLEAQEKGYLLKYPNDFHRWDHGDESHPNRYHKHDR